MWKDMKKYSKRDIAKILGRSHRNITYWTDFGLVIPDVQPSQGRGVPRVYSVRNLVEFAMIDIMLKQTKTSLDSIQYILKNLREGRFIDWERQKKIVGWGKPVKFTDFYGNKDWGSRKDVVYVYYHLIDISEHFQTTPDGQELIDTYMEVYPTNFEALYIVDEKTDWRKIVDVVPEYAVAQIGNSMLWLGRIKHQAMETYDIEYTDAPF
jgi:DNA-binding transcriptional MerR regulator